MAGDAGGFGMAAAQWEFGLFMIKSGCFFPTFNHMASLAFFPQIPFMGLVFAMAGKATMWRLTKFLSNQVAGRTDDSFVPALQRKLCFIMVENYRFQLNQLMIAACMLGMTGKAF